MTTHRETSEQIQTGKQTNTFTHLGGKPLWELSPTMESGTMFHKSTMNREKLTDEIPQSLDRSDGYSLMFLPSHTSLVLLLRTNDWLEEFISSHFSGYFN